MSTDEKPKFAWSKPMSIIQTANTPSVGLFTPEGQPSSLKVLDGEQAVAALRDLHDRVNMLESQTHWHTMPFQAEEAAQPGSIPIMEGLGTFGWKAADSDRSRLEGMMLSYKEGQEDAAKQLCVLRFQVAQFVEWLRQNWLIGEIEHPVANVHELLAKLAELGLMEKP